MPHHEMIALSGTIQHVFAHRFTLETNGTVWLADLGPKGIGSFAIRPGLEVSIEGERRPSEIKVTRIAAGDSYPVTLEHPKPHHAPGRKHPDLPADPTVALSAAARDGWTVSAPPLRRPKHFEILCCRDGGELMELHVDFAGTIYKQRRADSHK